MIYHFSDCVLNTQHHTLYRAGELIETKPRVFNILLYFIERRGELITHDELLQACWPGMYVSHNTVTRSIARVRNAIGHSEQRPLLTTIHRKGYRFIAEVSEHSDDDEADTPSLQTLSEIASITSEQRQITVLSCQRVADPEISPPDIEERYQQEQQFRQLCQEYLTPLGGYPARSIASDLVFYFGYPQALEDSARRAVLAGLQLLEQLPPTVALQIGIHTGPIILETEPDSDVPDIHITGPSEQRANQLMQQAPPSALLISETTARLVSRYFDCRPLTSQADSDHNTTTASMVYQVLAENSSQSDPGVASAVNITPFVGRKAELAFLNERWIHAQENNGQVVLLTGEAGIGKSRLIERLRDEVVKSSEQYLECHCSAYHQNTALFPLRELLRGMLQEPTLTSDHDELSRIEALVKRYQMSAAEAVPLLASLLSIPLVSQHYAELTMSPQQQRQLSFQLLLDGLLAQARSQTLLLVIEDLHWADPSTLEFIELLIEQAATACLMVVLTARPNFAPPWDQNAPLKPLKLERFSHQHVQEMLWRIAAEKTLPTVVIRQIIEKTDGIPLFIEELAQMLLESEQFATSPQAFEADAALHQLSVPLTLQDSLMARLDRLGNAKVIAQWASVLGREFSQPLLAAIAPFAEAALQQGLQTLLTAGVIYRKGLPPHTQYWFKHALIRDTAYQSMLKRQRLTIHRQVAAIIETQFSTIVAEHPELVAQHYTQAGQLQKAVAYWVRAGEKADKQWAHEEAIGHLTMALTLLQKLADSPERAQRELSIRIKLGPSLLAMHGAAHTTVGECYERAQALCQQLGEDQHQLPILVNLGRHYQTQGQYLQAQQLGEELLLQSQRQDDPQQSQAAYQVIGTAQVMQGQLERGCEALQQGLALADQLEQLASDVRYSFDPRVQCLCYMVCPLQYLGRLESAQQALQRLLSLAEQQQRPVSLGMALDHIIHFYIVWHKLPLAEQHMQAFIELVDKYRFPIYSAISKIHQGWLMAAQQHGDEGIAQMQQGLADYEKLNRSGRTKWRLLLIEACAMAKRPDQGLQILHEALSIMEKTGERLAEPALYRLQGELLLQLNNPDVAKVEACLQQALAAARRQQTKWWELRAAISLAQLWRDQNKPKPAYELLAPVYESFSVEFDIVYLQRAKSLLAQLGAGGVSSSQP